MTQYLVEVLVIQFLFWIGYFVFFRKETGFTANRIYLLLAPAVSMVLPFIEIPAFQPQDPIIPSFMLPEIILGNTSPVVLEQTTVLFSRFTITSFWGLGVILSLGLFIKKWIQINRLKKQSTLHYFENTPVYILPHTKEAFTFLNKIFIGESLSSTQKETVLLHEQVHKNQKHSWDLLYFELLRILFWFNPLIYLFQKELKMLHEYIADQFVVKQTNKQAYYQNLLSQVFNTSNISFINTFFNLPENSGQSFIRHSIIKKMVTFSFFGGMAKKRIIMLQKSNQKPNRLKYLLIIPMLGAMLFYASCSQETKPENQTLSEKIAELQVALENEDLSQEDKEKLQTLLQQYLRPAPPSPLTSETDVPFAVIDKAPVYPGCEGDNKALKKCFSAKLSELVGKEFNTQLAKDLNLTGKQRITVLFKIDKNGKVVNARARAPHPDLEAEALRIINMLPAMQPGEQDGKKVGVLYTLPIVFIVNE